MSQRTQASPNAQPSREATFIFALTLVVLALGAIEPFDTLTYWLETFPVVLALPILVATARRFPLTPLLYRLLFVHGLILILGGHYTYALVPLGDWLRDIFELSRNHYDRLGHLAQGFVPAILVRELLLRTSPLKRGRWLFYLVTSACLGFSAFYEMLEWWTALIGGAKSDAFLGTQGDVWDTQWDMFLCLVGALAAQILLGNVHDNQLKQHAPSRPV